MNLQEIISFIVNNGIGVVCVAYLIYFQTTTMKDFETVLERISTRLTRIESKLNIDDKEE